MEHMGGFFHGRHIPGGYFGMCLLQGYTFRTSGLAKDIVYGQ